MRRSTSADDRPSSGPFRRTFSRPVSSGLKPAPSSSRAATRPRTTRSPRLGCSTPQTSCSSVDLPAPLRPTMPTTSPRRSAGRRRAGRGAGARGSTRPLSCCHSRRQGCDLERIALRHVAQFDDDVIHASHQIGETRPQPREGPACQPPAPASRREALQQRHRPDSMASPNQARRNSSIGADERVRSTG